MLKNIRSHRPAAAKYTVIVDHPLDRSNLSEDEVSEAVAAQVTGVHGTIAKLGYQPEGLVAVIKGGVISVRLIARLANDEAALDLHALIEHSLCKNATTRFVFGESTRELHDHPLMQAA